MADKQRSQRARRGWRSRRWGSAFLSAGLIGALACSAPDATAPGRDTGSNPFGPGISGGNGTTAESALLGEWERFDVFDAGDDIVTQTTQWRFAADGLCRRTLSTFSAAEGIVRTETRDCTYAVANGAILLTLSGSATQSFSLSFAGFDPNRLVLDGLEYHRLA